MLDHKGEGDVGGWVGEAWGEGGLGKKDGEREENISTLCFNRFEAAQTAQSSFGLEEMKMCSIQKNTCENDRIVILVSMVVVRQRLC